MLRDEGAWIDSALRTGDNAREGASYFGGSGVAICTLKSSAAPIVARSIEL